MASDFEPPDPDPPSNPTPRDDLRQAVWVPEQNQAVRARLRAQLTGKPIEPVRVGRFALLRRVGAGAMGVVHAAYDDTLDRKVAIKLISASSVGTPQGRTRMLREAQALAKLSHPHVVQIYEAGLHDDKLFLAMEFVAGQTLRRWASEADGGQPWQAVLAAYRQAGLGLAAAHEAQLVHRDFKPENAMIDDDGHVRVLDFGLARQTDDVEEPMETARPESAGVGGTGLETPVTKTGSLVGTPAYMAPEQLEGNPADARSDQFSYCVSFWEALYGQRPFAGNSADSLGTAIGEGPRRPQPVPPGIPDALERALRRGLSADSAARWRDMEALLEALALGQAPRRRVWLAAGGGAALLAIALVGGVPPDGGATACTSSAQHLAGIWDEAHRREGASAFSTLNASFAASAWLSAEAALDTYSGSWTELHRQTCEATTVHGEQSAAVMDLRMTCLRNAKIQLAAVTVVFSTADIDVAREAHRVIGTLPPLSRCNDVPALQADDAPPPPAQATAVEDIQKLLATARAARSVGRSDAARTAVDRARTRQQDAAVTHGPTLSQLALEQATVLEASGDFEAAEDALREAIRLATRWGPRETLVDAVLLRILVVGDRRQQFAKAMQLRDVAEGLVAGKPRTQARLARLLGLVRAAEANYDAAESHYEDAVEFLEGMGEPNDLDLAAVIGDMANLCRARGDHDAARKLQERANAMLAQILGADHPAVAAGLINLAKTLHAMGDLEDAAALRTRAQQQLEQALGPDHPIGP